MRYVTCPQCNSRFSSRKVKCLCPHCDCAFMQNGAMFGSQATPLVRDCVPVDFESLPAHDQRWVHYLMTSISRQPNCTTDYVFIEMGWRYYLRFMTSNSWIAGTGSGLDRAYRLTENGAISLSQRDKDRCPFQSPPGCDPNRVRMPVAWHSPQTPVHSYIFVAVIWYTDLLKCPISQRGFEPHHPTLVPGVDNGLQSKPQFCRFDLRRVNCRVR
ncbi:hypothetical protein VN12_04005 [Pirellula sp. SH-Sr6A]|nr:hypothetical protein VN12_04005 [Pirellula sp. SH-Sr6A]